MKISSYCNNKITQRNISFGGFPANVPRKPVYLPEWFGEAGKWAGEYIGVPEQKLFLAASAFILQPLIDLKCAQEDKKADTAVKSASKALAGGITGFTIRAFLQKYMNDKLGLDDCGYIKSASFLNKYFMPSDAVKMTKINMARARIRIKRYNTVLSSIAAILIMAFITNEKIDVPLTGDFQDLFNGIAKDNKTWGQSIRDVARARYEKIKMRADRLFDILRSAWDKSKRIFRIIREDNSEKYRKQAEDESA